MIIPFKKICCFAGLLTLAFGAAQSAMADDEKPAAVSKQPDVSTRSVVRLPNVSMQAEEQTTQTRSFTTSEIPPFGIMCNISITLKYVDGGVEVNCPSVYGGGRAFRVVAGDEPSPEEVIGFVQPYIMALRTVQVIPSVGAKSPITNFQPRIVINMNRNDYNKISGMEIGYLYNE